MADKLSAFEVFPDRELKVGHPIVARLVGRKFDSLLESGHYDKPYDARFGKAMGGSGGGKPDLAQAGGKNPALLQGGLKAAAEGVRDLLAEPVPTA